jgi:hypothetical protein
LFHQKSRAAWGGDVVIGTAMYNADPDEGSQPLAGGRREATTPGTPRINRNDPKGVAEGWPIRPQGSKVWTLPQGTGLIEQETPAPIVCDPFGVGRFSSIHPEISLRSIPG